MQEKTQRSIIIKSLAFARRKVFSRISTPLGYDDLATIEVAGRRQYVIPESGLAFKTFPSITTVLGHQKNVGLEMWKRNVGKVEADRVCRIACSRGESLHSMVERYIRNDDVVISGTDMPDAIQMFQALLPAINKNVDNVRLQESPLYSKHLRVAGRVDLVADYCGKLSIIDIKSSARKKYPGDIKNYFIQECAYAIMFEERTGIPINQLVTLMGVAGGECQIFIEKRNNWCSKLHEIIKAYEETYGR